MIISAALILAAVFILASALLSAGLIVLLKPLLVRYALARPNARSSHKAPTPQGGGIAVVLATLLVAYGAIFFSKDMLLDLSTIFVGNTPGDRVSPLLPWTLAVATMVLAVMGAVDDMRPLPATVRLVLQGAAVALILLTVPPGLRIAPGIAPLWVERLLIFVAGLWFVNLTNFMDGLDWMTVAEFAPITAAIAAAAAILSLAGGHLLSLALFGALLGFAPFNKPVARLFLGDVGSLPIGLLVGWMLLKLAGSGALAAAILLPLYYLADATITLLKRLTRGERVWQAHRTHFYQQATDNGFSAMAGAAHGFGLNLVLAALALATLTWPAWPIQIGALSIGAGLVALVLKRFATPRLVRVIA